MNTKTRSGSKRKLKNSSGQKSKLQHQKQNITLLKSTEEELDENSDARDCTDIVLDNKETLGNEETSVSCSDEEKFYSLLPNQKHLYTQKTLVKFPLRDRVPTLVNLISHPGKIPSCSKWHASKKKWKSKNGELFDAADKPVCAYEDIYQSIYKVDSERKFLDNITVLSNAVVNKYSNITGVLVKFYCNSVSSDRVHYKRNRKNHHDEQIEQRKQALLVKRQEEINEFEQTFSACFADSLLKKHADPNTLVVKVG